MKPSTITFDKQSLDFIINGKPLLSHLKRHENITPSHYIPSLLSQTDTCNRLLGLSEPDLHEKAVAIYLCSHCGHYDGNPIGIKLLHNDNYVMWTNIGHYWDTDEKSQVFHKVRAYRFLRNEYTSLIETLKIYAP